jgi:xanthine dehydrogenase YagT iron-sulfur-binding subunit
MEARKPTRREIMGTAAGLSAMPFLPPAPAAAQAQPDRREAQEPPMSGEITLQINGQTRHFDVEPRTTLLDLLREQSELTGTKKGCDHGSCGACTVLMQGKRVLACLTLAMRCQNRPITTIEGLARGEELHPMQAAFLHHDAFQCGYCTPGQIVSAVALVQEGHTGSDLEIREWMSGNICRCGAYPNIVAAIREIAPAARKA